ncbi:hypothetical protein BCV69DRAFT_285105 [Microstroma glucosiphilum]|uniref:UBA domain-containing protein n=1 Tax=Pseudomicrostroma glucosiphilum TaxID=1684307 RepID=A0A316TZ14_9BASI|nr:hypothetical protein BCV69DRAFT_285105 [Pseudomicrostroma glucosiphilum]PWN18479.1 hypothetical protein BCV69DRAFT_285105 [Pseudomicrostroma glucosiphilum]
MDDLFDLDWQKDSSASSASSGKQAASSRPQAHVAPTAAASKQYSSYNFDALTRSLPSASAAPSPTIPRAAVPATTKPLPVTSAADDAFSSLLSSFGTPSSASNANASMADRQKASQVGPGSLNNKTSDAWSSHADWESLGQSASQAQPPKQTSATLSKPAVDPFDALDAFISAPESSRPVGGTQKLAFQQQPRRQTPKDPFDFSFDEDPGEGQSSALGGASSPAPPAVHSTIDDESDDDFLGVLGKPVQQKPTRTTHNERPRASVQRAAPAASPRPPSPPPHLLGQIVEMGFSPLEARKALAQTTTGLDVEAALESLLNGGRQGSRTQEDEDRRMAQQLQGEDGRDMEMEEYEERERQRRAARRGKQTRAAPRRDDGLAVPASSSPAGRRSPRNGAAGAGEEDFGWQKQADQIYSQASELGATVFTKANAFWSSAKAQAQKSLEERQLGSGANSSGRATPSNVAEAAGSGRASPAIDGGVAAAKAWARRWGANSPKPSERKEWEGKPRWMVEAEMAENEAKSGDTSQEVAPPSSGGEVFKDSDNEDEVAPSFVPSTNRRKDPGEPAARAEPVAQQSNLWDDAPPSARFKASTAAAKEEAGPKAYLSSARWAASSRSGPSSSTAPQPAARSVRETPVINKIARSLCPDDTSPMDATAASLKTRGNDAFKQGAYGEAEAAYSAAIERLSEQSLRRIPLLNNRSNARLKNGDAPAASRDAGAVLQLICSGGEAMFEPSNLEALPAPLSGEVNLRDAYSKALLRRAQAGEMLEKWIPALKDWTLLERYEKEQGSGAASGFKNMKSAQDGIKRCRGMMGSDRGAGGGPGSTASARRATASRQAAKSAAVSAVSKAEQAGRDRVRAANAAQAAEEAAADSLKDSIDARVNAWKAGKETNIRALLSSLENVVWESLGWKKVGMHEVITDAQVKKAYTRAMIKLHPDKLTPQSTALEHRLIGSAVFAVLNEAFAASTSK